MSKSKNLGSLYHNCQNAGQIWLITIYSLPKYDKDFLLN